MPNGILGLKHELEEQVFFVDSSALTCPKQESGHSGTLGHFFFMSEKQNGGLRKVSKISHTP